MKEDLRTETEREADQNAEASRAQPDSIEYLEFVGSPEYGTEFYRGPAGVHTVDAKHMKTYHDVDLGKKEVVWSRGSNGRFLVPVSDMTPEAVEVLAKDPMFKRVTI